MGADAPDAGGYRSTPLDVRRLSLFLAVVDHGGFSRAAAAVHISQPALSQAIAELEAELGGPLFHRLGRGVTLTEAGNALVGPARSVLRAVDHARQVASEIHGLARARLDLSALRSLSSDPLPELLGPFLADHPHVRVVLASPDDPAELLAQVRAGVAELGVTVEGPLPAGFESRPLVPQDFLAVLPPGTRPAADVVRPDALAGVPLVATPPGSSGREVLDAWMAAGGAEASVAVETSQREALLPLVVAGAGAALLPAGTARLAGRLGAVVLPVEPRVVRRLAVVRRAGPVTPAAAAFLGSIDDRG